MKLWLKVSIAGIILSFMCSLCFASSKGLETNAKEFVNYMAKGDYSRAVQDFDPNMASVLTPDKLKSVWNDLISKNGKFKQIKSVHSNNEAGYDVVYVACEFAKEKYYAKVVYVKFGKIGGLWFQPYFEIPADDKKSKDDRFTESDIIVGSGMWALPGTMTIPKGNGPFPAVVLVHGSGPNDRDESIGFNKPFKDIARGLAAKGIAVLRYDKRTKVHGLKMGGRFTVKEETIDDALLAVALLRSKQNIDHKRIFVLGHSLGGMLIPRIGQKDSKIRGFIVMAGSVEPLEDKIVEQLTYINSLNKNISKSEIHQFKTIKAEMKKMKNPKLSLNDPPILNAPTSYWLDLRGYHPPAVAKKIKQPMLIMQGGRDYQVLPREFTAWKRSLSGRKNVSFKLYPNLNHLFMEGKGKSTPSEYAKPGHVAKKVIDDIAAWVKAQ